jgi:electron transfer flavoprotein alpha subunit
MAETILFLAHVEDGVIARSAREALAAALALGGPVTVGLVGNGATDAARTLGSCGAVRFVAVAGDAFSQPRYATDAAAAEALCRAAQPSLVVAPGTSRWSRCLAGVAQRLGGRIDTHVVALTLDESGAPRAGRWFYRQRIEAALSRAARPWFLLTEGGVASAWDGAAADVAVETIVVETGTVRTQVEGTVAPKTDQQTIRPDAAVLFVAGAGWTKKQKDGATHVPEAGRLILDFINQTQASLGSSKSLVDLSGEGQAVLPFLSHLNQVGQTGSTPRHPKGLATCCHGEEPHVVGWRFVNERRAINLDANCGWARGKADVVYVANAFEVMERVNALLKAKA